MKQERVSLLDLMSKLQPLAKCVNISKPGHKYVRITQIRKAWSDCLKDYKSNIKNVTFNSSSK
jgi:hypothetical protein